MCFQQLGTAILILIALAAWLPVDADTASEEEMLQQFSLLAEVAAQIQKSHLEPPDSKELFYGAIRGMLYALDPYSQFLDPETNERFRRDNRGTFGGVGMVIGTRKSRLTVISPIDDTPAHRAGIMAGDIISNIEGTSTVGMAVDDAANRLRGEPGTEVNFTVLREGENEPLRIKIIRDIIQIQSVRYAVLEDEVGYIRITQFVETTGADVDKAFAEFAAKGIKGVIVDLRSNPGGLLRSAVEVSSDFLKEGQLIVSTKGRQKSDEVYHVPAGATQPNYPLVVLVNRGSASGSEIVAGAIKAHGRGLIMGERTFGKASVQTVIPLSEGVVKGSAVKLTVAHYYTPDDVDIHEVGIAPDVEQEALSASQVRMIGKLRASDSFKEFVKEHGDDFLQQLEDAEETRGREDVNDENETRMAFRDFVSALSNEQIVLSNSLIKYALAIETEAQEDDYKHDTQVRAAMNYLRALEVLQAVAQNGGNGDQ